MVFYAYIMYVERYSLQWKTNGSNVLIYNKKPIRVKRFLYYFYISVNPLSQLLRRAEYTKSRGVSFGRLTGTRGPGVTQSPYRSTQVLYTIILYITYIVFNYKPTYTTIRLISPPLYDSQISIGPGPRGILFTRVVYYSLLAPTFPPINEFSLYIIVQNDEMTNKMTNN